MNPLVPLGAGIKRPARRFGYRPALDGLRGVAILLVVAAHLRSPGMYAAGAVGVTVFFAISGYLITSLLLLEQRSGHIDLPSFYRRRVARLLPAFALVVAVQLVIGILVRGNWIGTVGWAASYLGNWYLVGHGDLGPLNHAWTLAVEEQFYLLWPWVVMLGLAHWRIVGPALVALAAVVAVVLPPDLQLLAFSTVVQAVPILLGCWLATLPDGRLRLRVPMWPALLLIGLLAFAPDPLSPTFLRAVPIAIGAAAMLLISAPPRWLSWSPLVRIGVYSYSLYLWHYPVAWWTGVLDQPLELTRSALALVLSLGLAIASYHLVERPMRAWISGRTSRVGKSDQVTTNPVGAGT
jgi:peptidoglycan/LPS O-acetylase OafA/YrhL